MQREDVKELESKIEELEIHEVLVSLGRRCGCGGKQWIKKG